MDWLMKFVLTRLTEASTWRGLVLAVAGAVGYNLSDAKATAIIALGVAVAGAIGAFLPDKLKE